MLIKNVSNALLGALLSLIAAYLLIVTFVLQGQISSFGWSLSNAMDIFIGAPIYTLAYSYWILLPIGLLFGLVIPLLVSKKTRREALVYGVVTGIFVGLVFTCVVAYDFAAGTVSSADSHDGGKWWERFWGQFASSVSLTIVYCSLWTSAYAFSKAGGARLDQQTP